MTANEVFLNKNISGNLPTFTLNKDSFKEKIMINELIVQMKLATSKSESRKLIRGKGVKKNREIISNEMGEITLSEFSNANEILISVGKKKHFLIVLK